MQRTLFAVDDQEIRTPMNAILGITGLLLQNKALAPDMKDALNKIYNSGDVLLGIFNDILDLSKIEAGKLELSPAKYETAGLINDTMSLNMMRIGSKPVEFQLSVDKDLPTALIGDELRIRQILNTLLSNAIKHTREGIIKLSVSSEKEAGNMDSDVTLVFTVSDTGQGMSEQQIAKLFDKLGMNITRNLVNMMYGKIFIKSEVNWGTVFTVRLPQGKIDSQVLGKELVESLQNFCIDAPMQPGGSDDPVDEDLANIYLCEKMLMVREACRISDKKTVKTIIAELRQKSWLQPIWELLSEMSGNLLKNDLEEVLNTAEKIMSLTYDLNEVNL